MENLLISLFINRNDAYAISYIKDDRVCYIKKEEQVTPELIKGHIEGKWTLGAYQLKKDMIKWFCLDFDENTKKDFEKAKILYNKLKEKGLHPLAEKSGGGDYKVHIWCFVNCKAQDAYYYLQDIYDEINITPTKHFPSKTHLILLSHLVT